MTQAVSWTEPVVLEGRHARLEPLGEVHLAGLCEVGLDPALWELTVSRVRDEADMRAYVEHALAEHAAGRALPFAIVERASGRAIGSTRYGNVDPPNRKLDGATNSGASEINESCDATIGRASKIRALGALAL